jgi:hypothetical protein
LRQTKLGNGLCRIEKHLVFAIRTPASVAFGGFPVIAETASSPYAANNATA